MAEEFASGTVWLVGAGPGDPDLLTRKAERLIRRASVVFHDALVGGRILALIPPGARCVSVGKRAARHSKDQRSINQLLIEAAQAGERVVRLKGGDPSIFGRSAEEMDALAEAGVDFRICPGITAAAAAAASASVSLTLRGVARALTFVTAHAHAGEALDLDWPALAASGTTLAVYMGKAAASDVARNLIAAGLAADTPALIVENASLPDERLLHTRLDRLGFAARAMLGKGPALLLIGHAMEQRSTTLKPVSCARANNTA